jgi:hypothetical protein
MRATFRTTDTQHLQHNGKRVSVLPLDESLYDRAETGPMYEVCDQDGLTWHAFADELIKRTA